MTQTIYGRCVICILLLNLLSLFPISAYAGGRKWRRDMTELRWVDYAPTTADPNRQIEATAEAIRKDLQVLSEAGFSGLVTYSSSGSLGTEFVKAAEEAGFKGVILGVWDPQNAKEIRAAVEAARSRIVLGICVGNEGLMDHRYDVGALATAVQKIREATRKPVTTTETIDSYDSQLLALGDWIFPNAHPYFSNVFDVDGAVQWTVARYRAMIRRSAKLVLLKEVGLPTGGDPKRRLSEEGQCKYYDSLARTNARFVYFEAFDQPWKTHLAVEPHWGVFNADRTPKTLARHLAHKIPCSGDL